MAPPFAKATKVGSDTTRMVSSTGAIKALEFSKDSSVEPTDFKPTCLDQVSVNSKYAAEQIAKFALR